MKKTIFILMILVGIIFLVGCSINKNNSTKNQEFSIENKNDIKIEEIDNFPDKNDKESDPTDKIQSQNIIEGKIPSESVEVKGLNLDDDCGHNIDMSIVNYGYNLVVDENGNEVMPQGRPIQEGYKLIKSDKYIDDYNTREYAQIFAYMGNIRDSLMCDISTISEDEWNILIKILELNNIKTTQSLTGTPKERYYSSSGIYEHLKTNGEDFHPMMKYLEEAELELKCLAFEDFNFVNPEGNNHCKIHNLDEGSGLILP